MPLAAQTCKQSDKKGTVRASRSDSGVRPRPAFNLTCLPVFLVIQLADVKENHRQDNISASEAAPGAGKPPQKAGQEL